MKGKISGVLLGVFFIALLAIPAKAEDKSAGDFLLDAALGAGEGAIVGKASGGKAGKGALIGAGTGLAREAIIKPMIHGGGGLPQGGSTTTSRSRVVEEEQVAVDPYTKGYQDGFKEGYNQGYRAGLSASQR